MLPVVGWNETADRRQFCFISVLFHDEKEEMKEMKGMNENVKAGSMS